MPVHDSFPPAKTRVVTKEGKKALVRRTNTERRKTGHQRTGGRGPLDVALGKRKKEDERGIFHAREMARGFLSFSRVPKQEMERFLDSTSLSILFISLCFERCWGVVNLYACVNSSGIQMNNDE